MFFNWNVRFCLCVCFVSIQGLTLTTETTVTANFDFADTHNRDITRTDDNNSSLDTRLLEQEDFLNKYVDDNTAQIIYMVQVCVLSSILNVAGIVSNVLNIIVFIKQGLGEVINISLLSLAVADLLSLLTLQWLNICFIPAFQLSDISFYPIDVGYLTGGWPRMTFTRISVFITAFITFERCICITMPLKVKMIITPRRTVMVIVAIFVILIGSVMPIYYTSRLAWRFSPERNRTMLKLVFTEDRQQIDSVAFAINSVFLPVTALGIVILCTVILAVKLKSKAKWRQKTTTKAEEITTKEKAIVKMVSVISTIFIICFLPNAVLFCAMACEPQFSVVGKYHNILFVTFSSSVLLESFNSSINIVVYLKMSSKFKETFDKLFTKCSIKLK